MQVFVLQRKEKREVVKLGFFFFKISVSKKSTKLSAAQCTQGGRMSI